MADMRRPSRWASYARFMPGRFHLIVGVATAAFILLLAACGGHDPDSAIGDCPDLEGSWKSGEYGGLVVGADGSHTEADGFTMTLKVSDQDGCHFVAIDTWSNGEIGGTQYAAGVLNPDGNWLTIVEANNQEPGGSSGRALGRLLENGQITFEYAAYTNDGSQAIAFSTILAREGAPSQREVCPDMVGTWTGLPFDALNVYADGTTDQQTGTTNVLEVVHQHECAFYGTNTWHSGELGGTEHVVGVLHSDGVLLTILEVGLHPEAGTRAFVQGHMTGEHTLDWDYVGISDDAMKGKSFSTALAREGEATPRAGCDDLTGTWSVGRWDGLHVSSDGSHEKINSDFHHFEIEEQIGCTVKATSTYAPMNGEEEGRTENWVGVINAEEGQLIMRTVAPPSDRLASMLFARIASDDELHVEYSGFSSDGTAVLVYLQRLTKE
jgi:hypothetical protein